MSFFLQPSILLLREGTDTSQGKSQIISNINACQSIAEVIRTTLGPRGMDKLITTANGVTISNDGATILKLLDVEHAAARTLVDISIAQDNEVGDGTTSVVLLAVELLKESKGYIEEGMHPQTLIKGYKEALRLALAKLQDLAVDISAKKDQERREILLKCAATSLNSKLLSGYKELFSELVVSAVEKLDKQLLEKEMIGVKLVTGGSISDSFLVDGVAFAKTFSYAGFEQQPKSFTKPKILLLNIELEKKAERENAEIRIDKPTEFHSIVDAEWQIIYEKLEKCIKSGAQVVLSKLPIGDVATQWFADRGIFAAGRVPSDDMNRVIKATGGVLQSTLNNITEDVLGTCGLFEEVQIGAERYNLFKECPNSKTATIIVRGGAEQFVKEAERSLNDAIMIVRRAVKASKIIAGAGAVELEISRYLRHHARTISGKQQLVVNSFAKALEVIPRYIADNAGLDSLEVLNKLRQKHANDGKWYGVDINGTSGILDAYEAFIWEPLIIKINALSSACEAACIILSIDETVKNPKSDQDTKMKRPGGGMPGGMPMMGGKGGFPGLKRMK